MTWPEHPRFLIPGVNDSWNDYQKFCKGKSVTGKDWKEARQALQKQYQAYLAEGGEPVLISVETQRCNHSLIWNICLFDLKSYSGRVRL
jgi:hypothetical protein